MNDTHQELGQIAAHLARHKVDAIIKGGWNIDLQFPELQYNTRDIDFIIATDDTNYKHLAVALNNLGVRETRGHIPMRDVTVFTAKRLRLKPRWRLHRQYGILDIMSSVGVIESYERLLPNSQVIQVDGSYLRLANPEIVLASKRAAGREKDEKKSECSRSCNTTTRRGTQPIHPPTRYRTGLVYLPMMLTLRMTSGCMRQPRQLAEGRGGQRNVGVGNVAVW